MFIRSCENFCNYSVPIPKNVKKTIYQTGKIWYNGIDEKPTTRTLYTDTIEITSRNREKIKISDPVYSFCEVLGHVDLNKYLTVKENRTGRPRYDEETLLKIILFAFIENGYASLQNIEKYCETDIIAIHKNSQTLDKGGII